MKLFEKLKSGTSSAEERSDFPDQGNDLGLPEETAKEIASTLDTLVATYSSLFHQYQKHHWIVEGPDHRDLHEFYEELYSQTLSDLDTLAERITALGQTPTSRMASLAKLSRVDQEPNAQLPLREMLESDLKNERELASALRDGIRKASGLEDYGSETLLKQSLLRTEKRAHDLSHYLAKESLLVRS